MLLVTPWPGATIIAKRGTEHVELRPSANLVANTPRMILELAVCGCGVAVADEIFAAGYVQRGELTPLFTDWVLPTVSIHAVTTSRSVPLRTSLFIDAVARELTQLSRRPIDRPPLAALDERLPVSLSGPPKSH